MTDKPDLARHPNAKARPLAIDWDTKPSGERSLEHATVHGYQEFFLTKGGTPAAVSARLQRQQDLLGPWMTRPHLEGKSFLDLGANAGFWSFLAASQGADPIVATEMDMQYRLAIKELIPWSSVPAGVISTISVPVQDLLAAVLFDVVHALGLLHWLYCCTADYGSLEAILAHLASLTRERLHVEWIAPEDPNIVEYGHLDWNPEVIRAPYTEENFLQALFRHFKKAERLGEHTPTRHIWVAFK